MQEKDIKSVIRLVKALKRTNLYVVMESLPGGEFYMMINKQYSTYNEVYTTGKNYTSLEEAINKALNELERFDRMQKIKEVE